MKYCPKANNRRTSIPPKLNATNGGDVARNNLVKGVITNYDTVALLLFDLSHTHSYISYRLVRELGLKPRIFGPTLNVSTLDGNQTLVDKQVGPS